MKKGFTLIELMMVVSILAILASVALPKFADMLRKTQEGALKGNLGAVRSALQIYYGDNSGFFPGCAVGANSTVLTDALIPKYMGTIPKVNNTLHPPTSSVYCDLQIQPGIAHDGQGWYYDGASPNDSQNGGVWVACDHTDVIGSIWTNY